MNKDLLQRASQIFATAEHALALTGAGISTPSGIPDFRSPTSGLWRDYDPMRVASLQGFRYHPDQFYDWIRPLLSTMRAAKPNAAHTALAELEELDILQGVITQNIDLLHSRAGSHNVFEVHGHVRTMTCIRCFTKYPSAPIMETVETSEIVPQCEQCDGVLKPDVILFGEQLPGQVMRNVRVQVRQADALLVAGSSLAVFPVADIPRQIKQSGGKLVIINLQATDYDHLADVVIHEDVAVVLPEIVAMIKGGDL